jgi:rhodanese-related sulfurtransferase
LTSRFGYTNVATMDGGIDDWSARIDPTIPRY